MQASTAFLLIGGHSPDNHAREIILLFAYGVYDSLAQNEGIKLDDGDNYLHLMKAVANSVSHINFTADEVFNFFYEKFGTLQHAKRSVILLGGQAMQDFASGDTTKAPLILYHLVRGEQSTSASHASV